MYIVKVLEKKFKSNESLRVEKKSGGTKKSLKFPDFLKKKMKKNLGVPKKSEKISENIDKKMGVTNKKLEVTKFCVKYKRIPFMIKKMANLKCFKFVVKNIVHKNIVHKNIVDKCRHFTKDFNVI